MLAQALAKAAAIAEYGYLWVAYRKHIPASLPFKVAVSVHFLDLCVHMCVAEALVRFFRPACTAVTPSCKHTGARVQWPHAAKQSHPMSQDPLRLQRRQAAMKHRICVMAAAVPAAAAAGVA